MPRKRVRIGIRKATGVGGVTAFSLDVFADVRGRWRICAFFAQQAQTDDSADDQGDGQDFVEVNVFAQPHHSDRGSGYGSHAGPYGEIGRASCRGRVEMTGGAIALKKI